ncbi:hypothetical protein [Bradyrhizobium sp. 142]|uniref:hypothetical protein n=1 Tax=Bradyrhizobium sp. 142 TaxID=2782618 RepID=UPI001FFA1377|nr:hypothetical protein [Bradyrhizobium sp. 142]
MRVAPKALLHQQCQALHAFAHFSVTGCDPDSCPPIGIIAASADPTRRQRGHINAGIHDLPESISIRPPADVAKAVDCTGSGSGITMLAQSRAEALHHPVDETARGVCKLSKRILSFSSSEHRRGRPVSTTSNRSI